MELYSYFRSSASYRVRIALALKRLDHSYLPVHLLKKEHLAADFQSVSPAQLVPALRVDDTVLTQSLAIIEYLEDVCPTPALLPEDPLGRARVRALALDVACEIHPLNNLRVLRYLVDELHVGDDAKNRWYAHWIDLGLGAIERQLAGHPDTGCFCHGDTPTMADVLLVPQIFNAQRMSCPLDAFPTVMRIFDNCMQLDAFSNTQPSACPDAT